MSLDWSDTGEYLLSGWVNHVSRRPFLTFDVISQSIRRQGQGLVDRPANLHRNAYGNGEDLVECKMAAQGRQKRRLCDCWSQPKHLVLSRGDGRLID